MFDPAGDPLGKLRDLVVVLRTDREPPRVLGLVMEVPPASAHLPADDPRHRSIDAGQIVAQARVDLRRFEQRPSETLVIGEVLDRHVTVRESGAEVAIVDAGIEKDHNGDWRITRLHVARAPHTAASAGAAVADGGLDRRHRTVRAATRPSRASTPCSR